MAVGRSGNLKNESALKLGNVAHESQDCVSFPLLLSSQFVSAEEPIRERIEWADIWDRIDRDQFRSVV